MDETPSAARPSPSPPVGAIVLALLAGLFYCGMLAAIEDDGFSDNAGNAMDSAFAGLFGVALWIVLAGLMLIALKNGKMPALAAIGAFVLLPFSAYAAYVAANVYVIDHGWTLMVPILVPPVIVFYALWVRIPALVATVSETTVSALAGVALVYLIAASMWGAHLSALNAPAREARQQAEYEANQAADEKAAAEQRAQDEAKYAALGPDSPLSDYLDYIGGDDDRGRHALDLARHANNRQADAIALLQATNGADNMSDLYRLNIEPTPELCATYNGALRTKATKLVPGYSNRIGEAIGLEFQLPNLKWLTAQHCDLTATLTDIAAKLRVIRDSSRIDQLADTFDALAKQ